MSGREKGKWALLAAFAVVYSVMLSEPVVRNFIVYRLLGVKTGIVVVAIGLAVIGSLLV